MFKLMKYSGSLAIIYNNFGPYHLARLDALTKLGETEGLKVVGVEMASREIIHPWVTDARLAGEKYTIFPNRTIEEIKPWQLWKGMWVALNTLNPRTVAMGLSRETIVASLAALLWSRLNRRTAVVLMDSKYDDSPRNRLQENLKRLLMANFDAALVGGAHSKEYAQFLGIPADKIFNGCDVVDNQYFASQTAWVREHTDSLREQHRLPDDYFLYVGQFEEKKNVTRLLDAYDHYTRKSTGPAWHLVLCGSGSLENELRQKALQLKLKHVHFAGFKQLEELPIYYGLAGCLIVPSSHHEQWGLVVNEAMASGLPVLVSKACGCAADLVQEGINGFTFDPHDAESMAHLMLLISSRQTNRQAMGKYSQLIIAHWSLETFSQNLLQAIEVARGRY
jgi:1,2-diacylglycerol 3-alpha-glucosyltransferase